MLRLNRHRRDMPLARRHLVLRTRTRVDAAWSTVIAHAIHRDVVHDGFVVDVTHVDHINVHDATVVEESIAVPTSADKVKTKIAEAVNDSSVKTHTRTPVALIENKSAIAPGPIGRSPQETDFGSQHPRARHPVIVAVVIVPGPVTGRPEITVARTKWLVVHRQCGRTERHRDPVVAGAPTVAAVSEALEEFLRVWQLSAREM